MDKVEIETLWREDELLRTETGEMKRLMMILVLAFRVQGKTMCQTHAHLSLREEPQEKRIEA